MNYDIEENNSKIYFNGSIWKTNNYGDVKIIGKSEEKNKLICEFKDGTILHFRVGDIKTGRLKNPNQPSIYGIGFLGIGESKTKIGKKITKEYNCWRGMIRRCYDKKTQIKNPTYVDCMVDKRWHNFQNFCKDIVQLEGYKEWKSNVKSGEYALDKDIKIKGNKIYSKDTCKFVTISENSNGSNKRAKVTGLTYVAIRLLDNYKEEFTNQSEFCLKYNLGKCALRSRLDSNSLKEVNGWIISIKED